MVPRARHTLDDLRDKTWDLHPRFHLPAHPQHFHPPHNQWIPKRHFAWIS
jgi:hypothetical protein